LSPHICNKATEPPVSKLKDCQGPKCQNSKTYIRPLPVPIVKKIYVEFNSD
jgi:hypothetical protein